MTDWPTRFKCHQDATCKYCLSDVKYNEFIKCGLDLSKAMRIQNDSVVVEDPGGMVGRLASLANQALSIRANSGCASYIIEKECAFDLFKSKNKDYGDAFVHYGCVGILVRLGDKFSRLASLLGGENERLVKTESISDTVIDIHNYCIMALMVLENTIKKDS